jgi:hypothetical protein
LCFPYVWIEALNNDYNIDNQFVFIRGSSGLRICTGRSWCLGLLEYLFGWLDLVDIFPTPQFLHALLNLRPIHKKIICKSISFFSGADEIAWCHFRVRVVASPALGNHFWEWVHHLHAKMISRCNFQVTSWSISKLIQIKKISNYKVTYLLKTYNFYSGSLFIWQNGSNFVHITCISCVVSCYYMRGI